MAYFCHFFIILNGDILKKMIINRILMLSIFFLSITIIDKKDEKKASLSYTVLAIKDNMTLVKIKLETGRPHQIRVQFASRGMCLVGDGKYGA